MFLKENKYKKQPANNNTNNKKQKQKAGLPCYSVLKQTEVRICWSKIKVNEHARISYNWQSKRKEWRCI